MNLEEISQLGTFEFAENDSVGYVQQWQCRESSSKALAAYSSDSEDSDIEVILNQSQSMSEESFETLTRSFALWVESEVSGSTASIGSTDKHSSSETFALAQWEGEGGACCRDDCDSSHIEEEDYVILEGYESDISSMTEGSEGEFEVSL